jgi:hypothetical protein
MPHDAAKGFRAILILGDHHTDKFARVVNGKFSISQPVFNPWWYFSTIQRIEYQSVRSQASPLLRGGSGRSLRQCVKQRHHLCLTRWRTLGRIDMIG